MTFLIIALSVALGVSFICSLLEATLLSLTPAQIAGMGDKRPRTASIWQNFKQNIEKPISVILILNTTAHTIGAAVAGAQFEMLWGERWLIAFSLGLTYIMLQFTEILPKTLGVTYNLAIAVIIARPLAAVVRGLMPLLHFVHFVNRPFESRQNENNFPQIGEIAALASVARTAGAIDLQQARLINAASRLPEMYVRQIMTPRPDVAYLRLDQPLEQILQAVQTLPFTRIPVVDRDVDHVVGMVHVRDLFNHLRLMPGVLHLTDRHDPQGRPVAVPADKPGSEIHVIGSGTIDLRKIMRNVLVVPERAVIPQVLRQFQESRIHLAVVVDEYGSMIGIVTLEDVLEEMVGEIEDEFDPAKGDDILQTGEIWRVRGTIGLHELERRLGLRFDEGYEEIDTLSGYFLKELGRFPETGDSLRIGDYQAKILTVERRRAGIIELRPVVEE